MLDPVADLNSFFQDIPKVDLHCHLYGTIREATLQEFVRKSDAPMSAGDVTGFYVRGEKPRGVLHAFRFMEKHIFDRPARLHRLTFEALEDLAAENVRYAEVFWNSTGTLDHNPRLTFEDCQTAITDAMAEAERELDIVARLIHAIDRQASPQDAVKMVESMIRHPDRRAIGVGIDYLETDHPPENFWKAYRIARDAGFKTTAHVGEFGCHWRNIDTAINLLDVDRLDHGYTILDNPDLLNECKERDLIVTVVPTNSYYMPTLDKSEWAEKHPIRQMARKGLRIHPDTDDPTFHNVTPALVWRMMHEDFGYGFQDLRQFMLNGLDGAWVDDGIRRSMKVRFEAEFDAALENCKVATL